MTGLFHLAWCPWDPFVFLQMEKFSSFSWMNNIPVCVCVPHPPYAFMIHGHLCYFHIWLLWIMLQWTWQYRYLFKILISIILARHPEIGLLDHLVVLFLIFQGPSILFSTVTEPTYISNSSAQCFTFTLILTRVWPFFFIK